MLIVGYRSLQNAQFHFCQIWGLVRIWQGAQQCCSSLLLGGRLKPGQVKTPLLLLSVGFPVSSSFQTLNTTGYRWHHGIRTCKTMWNQCESVCLQRGLCASCVETEWSCCHMELCIQVQSPSSLTSEKNSLWRHIRTPWKLSILDISCGTFFLPPILKKNILGRPKTLSYSPKSWFLMGRPPVFAGARIGSNVSQLRTSTGADTPGCPRCRLNLHNNLMTGSKMSKGGSKTEQHSSLVNDNDVDESLSIMHQRSPRVV